MITNILKFLAVAMFFGAAFMGHFGATDIEVVRVQVSGIACAVVACWD